MMATWTVYGHESVDIRVLGTSVFVSATVPTGSGSKLQLGFDCEADAAKVAALFREIYADKLRRPLCEVSPSNVVPLPAA